MADLLALPTEILDIVVEHLVIAIGIQKAVLLRTVSRAFDSAILHAICVTQVVEISDIATPRMGVRMDPTLRGKIIAVKSHSVARTSTNYSYLSIIAKVNSILDDMIGDTDPEIIESRHISVAGAVNIESNDHVDTQTEAQNLLSGAAITGNVSVLISLLVDDATDPNASTTYFYPPLPLAAARGHLAAVQCLLDYGARHHAIASSRYRPHSHHKLDDLADWNRYREDTVQSESLCWEPPTALRAAVRGGHESVVRLLLQPQYRLDTNSIEYLRAILAGAQAGRLDLIKKLFLVIGKDLSDFRGLGNDMLLAAIRFDRKEVVQWLLNKGVDVNAVRYHRAVERAVCSGNISMVQFLIERGAVVNSNPWNKSGYVPIEAASECGQEEVVGLLIEHGADPARALPRAAFGGQARLVRNLLNKFPDLIHKNEGQLGRSAMTCALLAGNLTVITALVESGVSLENGYEDPSHRPLNAAKRRDRPWVVNHLRSLGAQDTECDYSAPDHILPARGILISERTWEWVSKY